MMQYLRKITNKTNELLNSLYKKINFEPNSGNFIHSYPGLEKLGSEYGGWVIPINLLNAESICYSFGAGEDISFDIEMTNRLNCQIYCFDPTPRAKKYVMEKVSELQLKNIHFISEGLWHENTTAKFFEPENPDHVSHSITNIQKTDHYIEVPCKTLLSHMESLSHQKIDLLKMDIEGAEYAVIDDICKSNMDISIICLEFHYEKNQHTEIKKAIRKLKNNSYRLVYVDQTYNYTFLHQKQL